MRFMKGAKVEVLDRRDLPLGCWRCGEIIASNGHSCTVRYYGQSRKNTLAKVSSSVLRPCPPHQGIPNRWVSGDVLEVFTEYSWKMAKVMKPLDGDSCVVRLLGTFEEFRVGASETRVRQSWHNGKWSVIGQVSCITGECKEAGQVQVESRKRESSYLYLKAGSLKKHLACTEERNSRSGVIANKTKLPELIDVSLRIQDTDACPSCSMSRSEYNDDDDDDNDDACSIGSCSITGDKYCRSSPVADVRGSMSDAESFSHRRHEGQKNHIRSNSGEGLEAEVHSLELRAYRRTIQALHASGALSWERESLISNLRVSLNISSDEHLNELRVLLSANNENQL